MYGRRHSKFNYCHVSWDTLYIMAGHITPPLPPWKSEIDSQRGFMAPNKDLKMPPTPLPHTPVKNVRATSIFLIVFFHIFMIPCFFELQYKVINHYLKNYLNILKSRNLGTYKH